MFKIVTKLRVLPTTIFVAALLLSVKVSDILNGLESTLDALTVAKVQAQQPPPPPPPAEPANDGQDTDDGKEPADGDAGGQEAAKVDDGEEEDNPRDDPTLFTQTEIDLLQQLANRREEINARAEDLTLQEGLLKAAETRIDKKIQEMKRLELTIQNLIKTHDEQEEAKMQSLVKIYENMKPKDAAQIFEEMELDTLLLVAERMKERKLAPVMAQMKPKKAKDMTVELAKIRNLPAPGTNSGG
ncbi:MAG: hypothetical protein CMM74_07080 [Rhodospirillaceae bacterium]|nr:hypothetical protein [Rhodospirillaceae bacterium]